MRSSSSSSSRPRQYMNHLRLHAPATARPARHRCAAQARRRLQPHRPHRRDAAARTGEGTLQHPQHRHLPVAHRGAADSRACRWSPHPGDASGRRWRLNPLGADLALFRRPVTEASIDVLAATGQRARAAEGACDGIDDACSAGRRHAGHRHHARLRRRPQPRPARRRRCAVGGQPAAAGAGRPAAAAAAHLRPARRPCAAAVPGRTRPTCWPMRSASIPNAGACCSVRVARPNMRPRPSAPRSTWARRAASAAASTNASPTARRWRCSVACGDGADWAARAGRHRGGRPPADRRQPDLCLDPELHRRRRHGRRRARPSRGGRGAQRRAAPARRRRRHHAGDRRARHAGARRARDFGGDASPGRCGRHRAAHLILRDCTLVPGRTCSPTARRRFPGATSLEIAHPFASVKIERSIIGASVRTPMRVIEISDSRGRRHRAGRRGLCGPRR